MSTNHWIAFKNIGDTFMKDTKSIIFYTFSSWLNEKMNTQIETSFTNENFSYLSDGISGTLNQDYLLNLIGLENRIPGRSVELKPIGPPGLTPIGPPNPPEEDQQGLGLLRNKNYYEQKQGLPRFYY